MRSPTIFDVPGAKSRSKFGAARDRSGFRPLRWCRTASGKILAASETGVLDFAFERYLEEAEPKGISFEDWVKSPAYDPPAIRRRVFRCGQSRPSRDRSASSSIVCTRPATPRPT